MKWHLIACPLQRQTVTGWVSCMSWWAVKWGGGVPRKRFVPLWQYPCFDRSWRAAKGRWIPSRVVLASFLRLLWSRRALDLLLVEHGDPLPRRVCCTLSPMPHIQSAIPSILSPMHTHTYPVVQYMSNGMLVWLQIGFQFFQCLQLGYRVAFGHLFQNHNKLWIQVGQGSAFVAVWWWRCCRARVDDTRSGRRANKLSKSTEVFKAQWVAWTSEFCSSTGCLVSTCAMVLEHCRLTCY